MSSSAITVYLPDDRAYRAPLAYMLGLMAQIFELQFARVPTASQAQLIWHTDDARSQPLAKHFYENLPYKLPHHTSLMPHECVLKADDGRTDYLATAFYLLQCLQEYNAPADAFDRYGRFKYAASVQGRFEAVDENLVYRYMVNFLQDNALLPPHYQPKKSQLFLSFDIDALFSGWKSDGLAALKQKKYGLLFDILQAHFLKNDPTWLNIDQLMAITDAHGLKATFFWLLNKAKAADGTPNSDYDQYSPQLAPLMHQVASKGHYNGLHKSISKQSLAQELAALPVPTIINRNHYLHIKLPAFWAQMAASGLKADASLGFAEQYGFRNSFAFPFQPYDFEKGLPYDFVEIPLHLMDTTFYTYKKDYSLGMSKAMIDFMEKHRYNAVVSILWHNIYFTNVQFKRHLDNFKAVMSYCYEQGWQSTTPQAIVANYLKPAEYWQQLLA